MRRFLLVAAWLLIGSLVPGLVAAQDVKTHMDKGIANCEIGHFDQAMQNFNAALKLNPNDPALYDYRGTVYRCKGQNDKAIQDFNKAMELNPKFARAYRDRSMVYYDLGDFGKSLTDLKKAQSLGYKVDEDYMKMVTRKAAEKK
jgi:tetratricopeptide (TPR) repeat protein